MVDQCSKLHLVEWVTFFSNFSWTLFSLFCPNFWPRYDGQYAAGKLQSPALLVLLLRYLKRDQVNQMVPLQITPKGSHVLGLGTTQVTIVHLYLEVEITLSLHLIVEMPEASPYLGSTTVKYYITILGIIINPNLFGTV